MSTEVAAIVLLSAALHAGWNALIKISGDRVAVMAVVTMAGSVMSLAILSLSKARRRPVGRFLR